jgi:hypothetical protein
VSRALQAFRHPLDTAVVLDQWFTLDAWRIMLHWYYDFEDTLTFSTSLIRRALTALGGTTLLQKVTNGNIAGFHVLVNRRETLLLLSNYKMKQPMIPQDDMQFKHIRKESANIIDSNSWYLHGGGRLPKYCEHKYIQNSTWR